VDPYSFRPEAEPQLNYAGWPFGLLTWPLYAAFGPVVAWNVFVLLSFVAAGGLACGWLRSLGLSRGAALVGGLAFALAPYRVLQSTGHLLGPISILLAGALWAFERGRRGSLWATALAGAALASIPLSGQVHLALGAVPFFAAYALVRSRDLRTLLTAAAGVAAAVGAALLVQQTQIAGSISAGGRSLHEVSSYSAEWLDFVTRHKRHGSESFVFLGWLTPLLAAAGLVVLLRARRFGLAAVLGLGAVVPVLLALGTNLPLYATIWHHFPPLRYPRVPERFLPIACLAVAGLLAFAVGRARSGAVALLVIVALFFDLHVRAYRPSSADEGNLAYAALRREPSSRLLELPAFDPGTHYGGIYMYYDQQARRERPGGYSTVAPKVARRVARSLEPLGCGEWPPGTDARLDRLGVRYVTLHLGVFGEGSVLPETPWFAWRALRSHGFGIARRGGRVVLLTNEQTAGPVLRLPRPSSRRAHLCAGWGPEKEHGERALSEPHAGVWFYGRFVRLQLQAEETTRVSVSTEGRRFVQQVAGREPLTVGFVARRWHLVGLDVPERAVLRVRLAGVRVFR
jgi:hypothetical protein